MHTARTKVFNLLLCLALGGVIGGLLGRGIPTGEGVAFSEAPVVGNAAVEPSADVGVQAMQAIDDARQLRFALLNNLTRLAMSDLPRALELLPQDSTHDSVLRDWITRRLAPTRPDLAVQAAAAMRDPEARAALMTPSVFAWREVDAPLAARWLRGHMDDALARLLVAQSMNHDPAFVGRLLCDGAGMVNHPRMFRDLMQRWAQFDNADAFRFLELMPAESFQASMVEGVGGSLLSLPAGPVKVWLKRLPAETRAAVIEDMVSVLPSATTLAGARQWMEDMEPLAGGSDAPTQWFATLVRLAPEEALQSLDAIDDGPVRDARVSGFVQALGVRDRAAALDWTHELVDDQQRLALAQEQWLAWLQEDRTSAMRWLGSEAAGTVFNASQRDTWKRLYSITP